MSLQNNLKLQQTLKEMIKLTAKHYKDIAQPVRRQWPKYATQLLNIATQNSKATHAKTNGSVKEMWLKMRSKGINGTLDNWTKFYQQERGGEQNLIEAGQKVYAMLQKMGIPWITEEMCIDYIKELVYNKTHMGLGGEEMAIQAVARYYGKTYRFSNAKEEAQGIDGWVGDKPVQVKPEGSVFKGHVHNHPDKDKVLLVTYKKTTCFIHNPEFIK